jgi:predicted Zn-dependent peptidase
MKVNGVDPIEFELIRKQYYGRYLMSFNHVEGIGDALTDCACDDTDLFDEARIFAEMTVEDLNTRLKSAFITERSALSVIKPVQ